MPNHYANTETSFPEFNPFLAFKKPSFKRHASCCPLRVTAFQCEKTHTPGTVTLWCHSSANQGLCCLSETSIPLNMQESNSVTEDTKTLSNILFPGEILSIPVCILQKTHGRLWEHFGSFVGGVQLSYVLHHISQKSIAQQWRAIHIFGDAVMQKSTSSY